MLNRKIRHFVAGYRHGEVSDSGNRDANHLASESFSIFRLVVRMPIEAWYVLDSFSVAKFPVVMAP